jgi:hypothetical protein
MTKGDLLETAPGLLDVPGSIGLAHPNIGRCSGRCEGIVEETPNSCFNILLDKISETIQNDDDKELGSVLISLKQRSGVVH